MGNSAKGWIWESLFSIWQKLLALAMVEMRKWSLSFVAGGQKNKQPSHLNAIFLCHTSPPIDAHCVPSWDPGQRPPHDAIIDVKINQCMPDFVRHVLHRVEAKHMWLTIAADNNADRTALMISPCWRRASCCRPAARRMRRMVEGKWCHQIDNPPSLRMPLRMTTNNDDGNGDSDRDSRDDGNNNGSSGSIEDKGGE